MSISMDRFASSGHFLSYDPFASKLNLRVYSNCNAAVAGTRRTMS